MKTTVALICLMLCACGKQGVSAPREVSPRQTPTVTTQGVTVTGYANVGVKRGF